MTYALDPRPPVSGPLDPGLPLGGGPRALPPGLDGGPGTGRDLQAAALDYIECYQGDLLQLEHAWEFLYAALTQAAQRGEAMVVVRLAAALAHPAGRLHDPAIGEHILRLGVAACRQTGDRAQLARFLNRLAGLLFAHGQYRRGRRLWHSSLALAGAPGTGGGLWDPLASFAQIADILDDYPTARRFAATVAPEEPDVGAVGLFVRGFYARLAGDPDCAHADLSACLRLAAPQPPGAPPTAARQLFTLVAQAELARVQGHYARARDYTETAVALAQLFADPHTVVDVLADQALFAAQQDYAADAQALLLRAEAVARHSGDAHLQARCRLFVRRLGLGTPPPPGPIRPGSSPLSARETEVLHLVAVGLSNQEIARRLVITPGTVKKHLEHIYTKLDAPSRTAAVAQARTLALFP